MTVILGFKLNGFKLLKLGGHCVSPAFNVKNCAFCSLSGLVCYVRFW